MAIMDVPSGPDAGSSSFPQVWERTLSAGTAEPLLEQVLRENRELREQKEFKGAELVKALRAQQLLEKSCAEVMEENQGFQSEVQHLQHKIAEMDSALKEERRHKEEAQQTSKTQQQRLQEMEKELRQIEQRFGEQKERNKDLEEKLRQAEARANSAERAAQVSSEKAKETEQQCRVKAEKDAIECRLKYAELGAARQKEMQAALLELQGLARGQELLRAELSRVLRPLPAKPMGSYLAPPMRPLPSTPPTYGTSPLRQAARSPNYQSPPNSFESTMQREWRSPPTAEELRRSLRNDQYEPLSRSFRSRDVVPEPMQRDLSPGAAPMDQSCP